MNARQRFEFYKTLPHFKQTAEQFIEAQVNLLINALYIPVKGFDSLTKLDPKRIKHFNRLIIVNLNWGDLKVVEVNKMEGDCYSG